MTHRELARLSGFNTDDNATRAAFNKSKWCRSRIQSPESRFQDEWLTSWIALFELFPQVPKPAGLPLYTLLQKPNLSDMSSVLNSKVQLYTCSWCLKTYPRTEVLTAGLEHTDSCDSLLQISLTNENQCLKRLDQSPDSHTHTVDAYCCILRLF